MEAAVESTVPVTHRAVAGGIPAPMVGSQRDYRKIVAKAGAPYCLETRRSMGVSSQGRDGRSWAARLALVRRPHAVSGVGVTSWFGDPSMEAGKARLQGHRHGVHGWIGGDRRLGYSGGDPHVGPVLPSRPGPYRGVPERLTHLRPCRNSEGARVNSFLPALVFASPWFDRAPGWLAAGRATLGRIALSAMALPVFVGRDTDFGTETAASQPVGQVAGFHSRGRRAGLETFRVWTGAGPEG